MNSVYLYSILTDLQLKEKGNCLFIARKYRSAIFFYTIAIIKNPSNATYFTNRALCHLKLKQWQLCSQDCQRALQLDSKLLKAHFFLGQCLIELEMYNSAIKHLRKAFDLSREQKENFGGEIIALLLIARNKSCNHLQQQEIELKGYLSRLIKEDMRRSMLKRTALETVNVDIIEKRFKIFQEYKAHMKLLNNIFARVDEQRRVKRNLDIPPYLCGKISLEILSDPVITPSGITYERKYIEEHLKRCGHFDPITRVKLTKKQLIPNFSIKEAVDAFLTEKEGMYC